MVTTLERTRFENLTFCLYHFSHFLRFLRNTVFCDCQVTDKINLGIWTLLMWSYSETAIFFRIFFPWYVEALEMDNKQMRVFNKCHPYSVARFLCTFGTYTKTKKKQTDKGTLLYTSWELRLSHVFRWDKSNGKSNSGSEEHDRQKIIYRFHLKLSFA